MPSCLRCSGGIALVHLPFVVMLALATAPLVPPRHDLHKVEWVDVVPDPTEATPPEMPKPKHEQRARVVQAAVSTSGDVHAPELAAPVADLHRLLRRLGAEPVGEDEARLKAALHKALGKAKTPLLRALLDERGRECRGCTEKGEFVRAVIDALDLPLVGRSGLALFELEGAHLFPQTKARLHFFEGRYKLMVERALATDRQFGIVSAAGLGTVARITEHSRIEDGRFLVTVLGGPRFTVGRRWAEECEGCESGPLHLANVAFFNDMEADGLSTDWKIARELRQAYFDLVDDDFHDQIEGRIGPMPSDAMGTDRSAEGAFATSMWFSAACAAFDACAAGGRAERLLRGTSTEARLSELLAFVRGMQRRQSTSGRQEFEMSR